jgi:hypothetical protein
MHAQRIVGPKRLQDFLQVRHGRVPDYLIRFDNIDVPGSPVITIRSSTSIIQLENDLISIFLIQRSDGGTDTLHRVFQNMAESSVNAN